MMASKALRTRANRLRSRISRAGVGPLEIFSGLSGLGGVSLGSADGFESLIGSIRKVLSVPEESAAQYARQVLHHENLLGRWAAKRQAALRQSSGYPPHVLSLSRTVTEIATSPAKACVLALPASYRCMMLIAHLHHCQPDIQVIVLDTHFSRLYLAPEFSARPVRLVGPAQMTQLVRASGKKPAKPSVYVTFPDHQVTGSGTMWPVSFCGNEYRFSVLEPLILSCLDGRLLTLELSPTCSEQSLSLVKCPGALLGGGSTQPRAREILIWLAERIEGVVREFPGEILSWNSMLHRSTRFERWDLWCQLKALEGAVIEWRRIDKGRNLSICETALRSLSALEALVTRESLHRTLASEATLP